MTVGEGGGVAVGGCEGVALGTGEGVPVSAVPDPVRDGDVIWAAVGEEEGAQAVIRYSRQRGRARFQFMVVTRLLLDLNFHFETTLQLIL